MHQYFRQNLNAIFATAADAGVPVLAATVATNLQHCAPFGSAHRPDLNDDQRRHWESVWKVGTEAEAAGEYQAAIAAYRRCEAIDAT